MIEVPSKVLNKLAEKCGIESADLAKMSGGREDSDGVIYRPGSKPILMKVLALPLSDDSALGKLVERFRFARSMGDHGVRLVFPRTTQSGALYESVVEDDHIFVAYLMDYIAGANIRQENWRSRFFNDWGRLVGKMHAVTKEYPIWEHATIKTRSGSKEVFGWQEEWQGFYDWCKDSEVKESWMSVKERLEALPINRDCYGFIHNDPHAENLIYDGKYLRLIDFDVANCHWFMTDISIALQMTLFSNSGGMERPVHNRRNISAFMNAFRTGYKAENQLDDFWWGQLDLFVNYRRLLLYTVMQDWINSNVAARAHWKDMIRTEPRII